MPTKYLMSVLQAHQTLETVDAPGEYARTSELMACIDGMPALRLLDTQHVRVSRGEVGGGAPEALWTVEIAAPSSRLSYTTYVTSVVATTEICHGLGDQLGALHVATHTTLSPASLADIAARCRNLGVVDVSVGSSVSPLTGTSFAGLLPLPLREVWLTIIGSDNVLDVIYALAKTSAHTIQLERLQHLKLNIGPLAHLQATLRRAAASSTYNVHRSLILKRAHDWGMSDFAETDKAECVGAALLAGFDLFLD